MQVDLTSSFWMVVVPLRKEEIDRSEMLIAYSRQIVEINRDKLEVLRQALKSGKLDIKALQIELGTLTRQALDRTMEVKFE